MFATSKFVRLACLAMLAALPIGGGLFQPAGARAAEIIRVGTIVRRPVVTVVPAVPVAPVVRVGPVYARPYVRTWYSYRWYRWYRWHR
jgi:hypothetical protein